jgi:hypothetical protein
MNYIGLEIIRLYYVRIFIAPNSRSHIILKLVYIWLASGDATLRASPVVLSIRSHRVKLDEKKSTYAGLAQEIGFGSA